MIDARKKPTLDECRKPCICCGYQPVHRHHVLRFSIYPDASLTIPLCPNCHDLYHKIESANAGIPRNQALLKRTARSDNAQFMFLLSLADDAAILKKERERLDREIVDGPERFLNMHNAGKTIEEIYESYGFLKNVRFKVMGGRSGK